MPELRRSRKKLRWIAGALLLVPIIFPLLAGTYTRSEPEFLGFPFFYWYQFLWIVIGTILTAIAYYLVSGKERRNQPNPPARRGKHSP